MARRAPVIIVVIGLVLLSCGAAGAASGPDLSRLESSVARKLALSQARAELPPSRLAGLQARFEQLLKERRKLSALHSPVRAAAFRKVAAGLNDLSVQLDNGKRTAAATLFPWH